MGRRRRKVVRVPKKRLPRFFTCPKCGKKTVMVELFRGAANAVVSCSSCGVREEFPIKPALREIDVYCMFTDKMYSGSRGVPEPEIEGVT